MQTTAVRKWNYGHYQSDNYGAHSLAVDIGTVTFYFSYDTVIGFHEAGHTRKVSENVWTVTTGKHLNWVEPVKSRRLPHDIFQKELDDCLARHNLKVS